MSEGIKRKYIELVEQEDGFLLKEIGATKDEIKTKEDLKRFQFTCSICKETKSADNAVLLQTPLEFSQKADAAKISVEVNCRMLVACKECASTLKKRERVS